MFSWSISCTEAIPTATPEAFARMTSARRARVSASSFFESSLAAETLADAEQKKLRLLVARRWKLVGAS